MKWIVFWWVISCVPCDKYFLTHGKEPCYETKATQNFALFDRRFEAASFAASKKTDGRNAEIYLISKNENDFNDDARLVILEKWEAIHLLEKFASIPDEQAEKLKGVDAIDFGELDELIRVLRSGDVEFLRYIKPKSE